MTPTNEDIVLLVKLIKEGIQSPELMAKFGVDRNGLDWWVKMAGGQRPLDLRKHTCHLTNDEIEDFQKWHIKTQATTLEIRQRCGLSSQGIAVAWLEELGLTVNKRRPKSAAAGGEAFGIACTSREAKPISDEKFAKVARAKMNLNPPEYQGSIADRFRAQGLATANPYR